MGVVDLEEQCGFERVKETRPSVEENVVCVPLRGWAESAYLEWIGDRGRR